MMMVILLWMLGFEAVRSWSALSSPKAWYINSRCVSVIHANRQHASVGQSARPSVVGSGGVQIVEHATDASVSADSKWATHGLLFSSFTDGVEKSPAALAFLKRSLVKVLAREQKNVRRKEEAVRESVTTTLNIDPLDSLDRLDQSLNGGANAQSDGLLNDILLDREESLALRVLYIPTAMYALRADSTSTPGKQRQRARADAKKRRGAIAACLQTMLGQRVQVMAVTLDLDDGTVKQPSALHNQTLFPKNGNDALTNWKPHILFVEGGNTFWLQYCIDKGNWTHSIISACTGSDAAVYCGKSAGAIIAGASIDTAAWKGWDDPTVVPKRESCENRKDLSGLNLVGNASIFPHMSNEWTGLVREKSLHMNGNQKLCCLREFDALCVEGDRQELHVVSGKA